MSPLQTFEAHRADLLKLGYRMLGERHGAEDVVQDTWLRWSQVDATQVHDPAAWLRKTATRIALDVLRSARARRERYVGPWLPEPLLSVDERALEDSFIPAQECELALLWAMERLNAAERAAFILREAFDADYAELAEALERSQAACRQLVSRAHKKLQEAGPRFDTPAAEKQALLEKFFSAVMMQDFQAAVALLSRDARAWTDGGGKRRAALRVLEGPEEITKVMFAVVRKSMQEQGWQIAMGRANNAPALIRTMAGAVDTVTTLASDRDGRIRWLYVMRNPEKLPPAPSSGMEN